MYISGKIGDRCLIRSDCLSAIGNSDCIGNRCSCKNGYYTDDGNTVCHRRK